MTPVVGLSTRATRTVNGTSRDVLADFTHVATTAGDLERTHRQLCPCSLVRCSIAAVQVDFATDTEARAPGSLARSASETFRRAAETIAIGRT